MDISQNFYIMPMIIDVTSPLLIKLREVCLSIELISRLYLPISHNMMTLS